MADHELRLQVSGETIYVTGEVDLTNAESLRAALLTATGDVVVADLAQLTLIDAAGLTALIAAERHLRDQERVLVLRRPRAVVKRILDLTGLTWLLEFGAGLKATDNPSPSGVKEAS